MESVVFQGHTRNDVSDLTSSTFGHTRHHQKISSSQTPYQSSTSRTAEKTDLSLRMTSPLTSLTHEAGAVKFNIMKHQGHGDDLDAEKAMKEDGYDKALEAELETEFTKVDLSKLEAQTVSASAITSATPSNDQNYNVAQEDSVRLEPQAASEKTTKKSVLDSPESDKQILEGVESEKVEDNQSDIQNATKNKEEEETHQLRGSCVDGEKQSQKEETPEEIKKHKSNGGEASTTKGSMQTVTSNQEQDPPMLLTSSADM